VSQDSCRQLFIEQAKYLIKKTFILQNRPTKNSLFWRKYVLMVFFAEYFLENTSFNLTRKTYWLSGLLSTSIFICPKKKFDEYIIETYDDSLLQHAKCVKLDVRCLESQLVLFCRSLLQVSFEGLFYGSVLMDSDVCSLNVSNSIYVCQKRPSQESHSLSWVSFVGFFWRKSTWEPSKETCTSKPTHFLDTSRHI